MATYEGGRRHFGNGQPDRPVARAKGKVPPHILRGLGTARTKPRGRFALYFLLALAVLTLVVPTAGLAAGGAYYTSTAATLKPRLDKLASYRENAFQTSRIFARDGTLLYEFVNAGRRDQVKLDQIADVVKEATIAIEDKTFYENVGVDYLSIVKAAYRNFTSGEEVSGASTITQQLIKLVVLNEEEQAYENRYRRKLTEIVLAQQIGDEYSKDEILELYLNEINYGNLAYGIQAAAKSYFNVDASELDLNQGSLLAGLPQSPTFYNPIQFLENGILKGVQLKSNWLNPEARLPNGTTAPRARQVAVLRQMVLSGKISNSTARSTIAQDLQFREQTVSITAPHFVFYVEEFLEKNPIIRQLLVNEGGLNITTTLDLRIQEIAQREAAKRIAELEAEERNIHNAAVVVQQPGTGEILAMVGSVDYNKSKATTTLGEEGNVLDGNVNVTTRLRQPGSALKPFTYLSGIAQGKLNAGSVLWDVETKFPIKAGATKENLDNEELWYGPTNFDQKWRGPIRMRESLAGSLNMPAVKALKQAGVGETIDLLHRVGITGLTQPPEYYGLALTLGGGEVTPLDLTTAYNTLANNGQYIEPTPILKITDRSGNDLTPQRPAPVQVVDPKAVAIVRDFMGDNEARAPIFGRENPLNPSRPAHAKTGTTEDFRDAWAVGFTPYVTVGVWTGNNNNEKTAKVESTVGGGVIWNRIMETLFKDPELDRFLRGPDLAKPLAFPSPETFGVQKRKICQIGGRFGQRSEEWFIPEQADPGNDECALYKTITVVAASNGGYCMPVPGVNYGNRLRTFRVWSLPPSTEEEYVVDPSWESGTIKDSPIAVQPNRSCDGGPAAVAPALPGSRAEPVQAAPQQPVVAPAAPAPQRAVVPAPAAPAPAARAPAPQPAAPVQQPAPRQPEPQQPAPQPPAQQQPAPRQPEPAPVARIPSLVGLGENQARGVLAGLGITNVGVDYQGADRLGALYDQFPAYAVVSHSPGPGTPITPGMGVVLGIRAP